MNLWYLPVVAIASAGVIITYTTTSKVWKHYVTVSLSLKMYLYYLSRYIANLLTAAACMIS